MSITTTSGTTCSPLEVPVELRLTPAGAPLAVRYDERIWVVAAEPFHWFSRASWWLEGRGVPKGAGDVVNVEYWRIQVRLTASSTLRTFTVRRDPRSEQWILENVDDAQH